MINKIKQFVSSDLESSTINIPYGWSEISGQFVLCLNL